MTVEFMRDAAVADALAWPALIRAIEATLTDPRAQVPERSVHTVPVVDKSDASLLLKSGWIVGDVIVVKVVTFFPDNGTQHLPTVNAAVVMFDATTGELRGVCEGNELTTRRTAAASAVAAKHLAPVDAKNLLIVGTGALAPMAAQAHASVRKYERIQIWGRNRSKAEAVAEALVEYGLPAEPANDLNQSVSEAHTISCVTGSTVPLVRGADLTPGTHIDLIGSFTSAMRETDDEVIERAHVWVDTRADGVRAGDLAQPIANGTFNADDIQGDLAELIDQTCPARRSPDEITLFKSAGTALEDVAAARLALNPRATSDTRR